MFWRKLLHANKGQDYFERIRTFQDFEKDLSMWKDNHQDQYDSFERRLEAGDGSGYSLAVALGMELSAIRLIRNSRNLDEWIHYVESDWINSVDVEKVRTILKMILEDQDGHPDFMSFFYWILSGRGFESSTAFGLTNILGPHCDAPDGIRLLARLSISMLIKASLIFNIHTLEDWEEFARVRQDLGLVVDPLYSILEEIKRASPSLCASEVIEVSSPTKESRPKGRPSLHRSLSDLLPGQDARFLKAVIDILEHPFTNSRAMDMAYLMSVLENSGRLEKCTHKEFLEALLDKFPNLKAISVSSLDKAMRRLTGTITKEDQDAMDKIGELLEILPSCKLL